MKSGLIIKDLGVGVSDSTIIQKLNLQIHPGEVHAIMGPNGSGKSTLCNALMGHPKYQVKGEIWLADQEVSGWTADKRAQAGMFLGFQYPQEVSGITFGNFLRQAVNKKAEVTGKNFSLSEYHKIASELVQRLKLPRKFVGRGVNEGFSGGEKKRAEIVQMLALKPKFVFLDEIDSGLDLDGLQEVANGINEAKKEFNPGVLLITHYQRLLHHVRADFVHVMVQGNIVESGGMEIVERLEKEGYQKYFNN